MDAAMLWVTLVSALAAVAAAVFGFVQANEAMKSRNDANAARVKAEQAEVDAVAARDAAVLAQQESASAAGRIAEVLEEQAAAVRAAAEVRPDPWLIRPGSYRKTGKAILLTNTGKLSVDDVTIALDPEPYGVRFTPNPAPASFRPGEGVEIYRYGGQSVTTLIVRWRWTDSDEMNTTRGTLS